MIAVYVAGPYTKPDPCDNTRNACLVADELLALGFLPFIPHLSHLWHLISPKPYETWMDLDMAWLNRCDVLLRMPGESSGADREVEFAKSLGLPIYYSVQELLEHFMNAEG
jgi:hypothetical protein